MTKLLVPITRDDIYRLLASNDAPATVRWALIEALKQDDQINSGHLEG